ncbi:MAG: DUF222 domain-containing protein, partial [Propionibacteriaceae bacterium]|nr:DUF222 domain-containing protein [Propionibacteriaceae bacterium]
MYHPTLTTTADALAALDHATTQVVAGEVGQVLAIAALCDVHEPDASVLVDGSERYLQMGADGTPVVGEFIAADIAALLGVSPGAARSRIAQVLNLRHRHPVLWHTVCAGDVRFWEAARIADACVAAGLDAEGAAWVDRQCGIALALQPWARVRSQVDGWILMADPELAAERELQAAAARYIRLGQLQKGHIPVWGQLDAADGLAFDDALTTIANTLEVGVPLEERRAIAVGILARGAFGQSELPRAEVIIRIDATPTHDGNGVELADAATVEGWGTALTRRLSDLLPGCQVRVRPIVDARSLDPVDSYE